MLSVEEALQLVLFHSRPLPVSAVDAADLLGRVLAEDIASDVDSPPHDKSIVDGYAVRLADLPNGEGDLQVLEEVTAGAMPTQPLQPGATTRIMTGAPIPAGAEAVVMVERSELLAKDSRGKPRVRLQDPTIRPGQNIVRRAASMARGQRVLHAGTELRAIELGLLAEVGRTQALAFPRPTLAVLATGNELVIPAKRPGPGQIRNSNGPLLLAAAQAAGAIARDLGIARDEPEALRHAISLGLQSDILVLSGGVSAGVLDLVPGVFADLGVRQVFHKVRLKPGKPLWFGVVQHDSRERLVFGLPGNPVSSLVCFELFVRPAIARLAGRAPQAWQEIGARLTADFAQRGDRLTLHPARLEVGAGQTQVTPLGWQGSGDLRALTGANALACFPPGDRVFRAGETIGVLPLR